MFDQIVLGIIQGVGEWLPVSSSGLLVLAQSRLFEVTSLSEMVRIALFLHAGTLLAALVYFWKEIKHIFKPAGKNFRKFLIISTLISGGLGYLLLKTIVVLESNIELTGKWITGLVGLFLVITGLLQIKQEEQGERNDKDLGILDSVIFGIAQGIAVLPGFSRSALTVAVLLFRKVEKISALKISFIGGLPIIFAGNILLNADKLLTGNIYWPGMLTAFFFGLLTIHWLLKLARKVNFGYFVTVFGLITLVSSLI
jgi:undecaprenyl-diphosphatase